MQIEIVTLFPEMFAALDVGIPGRAIKAGLLKIGLWNPRDFTKDKHRTVDDKPYGGGPGMLMKVQPLRDAIHQAKKATQEKAKVIYLSPQGRPLDQQAVKALSAHEANILVAGRYEGIDERLLQDVIDEEISIGDYVLSGGELAAMVIVDCIARLLPGALGHEDSAAQDSFFDGLLDYPHYTRPMEIDGKQVPSILVSGDHQAIAEWRKKQALGRTWLRRPDLLQKRPLTQLEQKLLNEFIHEYTQTANISDKG